jgi:putative flippase GtrA
MAPREPFLERALRFGRAIIVGSGATLADFSVFETCVRIAGIAPTSARLPALLTGACCQFFGNRSYTFRARAGSLSHQARSFLLAEAITLGLNWSIFRLLVTHVQGVPPELLSGLGTCLVFLGFAYPIRRWVIFKLPARGP